MRSILFYSNEKLFQAAWCLLRMGVGITFIIHGYAKVSGGEDVWIWLGQQLKILGIDFLPAFWGFMAAMSEFAGGILLVTGLFTRGASLLLLMTMFIALLFLYGNGSDYNTYSHPLKLLFVFAALLIGGSGKFSLDALLFNPKPQLNESKRIY